MTMAVPVRLEVQYPNRRALLAAARTEGAALSLFVPGSHAVTAGDDVRLEVTIAGTDQRFEVEGHVRIRVAGDGSARGPGLGVIFRGEQKRAAAEMLGACAGRAAGAGTAVDARHDVDVPCVVNHHGHKVAGALRDVSSTGAFIGAPTVASLRGQAELLIQVEPLFGRWGGQVLKARVIWVGEKKGIPGFGVRFLEPSALVRERLKKHLPEAAV